MRKLLIVASLLFMAVVARATDFPEITISDLKAAISAKKVTVVDVNGTESWKSGHIPGAIDYQSTKDKLASLLPQDKNALIVAYCGGPKCAAYRAAAQAARELGYKNVKHLVAGISGWRESGQPEDKGS
jgi:rhodanese-related sulfurtransferase